MSNPPALLGIDIGTTNLKAVAFDDTGNILAKATAPTPTQHPQPGWAEHDPEAIWQSVAGLIRDVVEQLSDQYEIAAVAAASMGEAGVLLDEHGEALHPIIAWYDNRTQAQEHYWRNLRGDDALFEITGLPLHMIFGVNKLMWLTEHAPQAMQRARCWLNMADFIAYKLSGATYTDYSLASRMMLLDLKQRAWSQDLIQAAGLRQDILPPLINSGEVIGRLTPHASRLTHLTQGTPVTSGGHDHICGALSVDVARTGDVLDSIGTSEGLVVAVDQPILKPEQGRAGYTQGAHVVPGQYYMMGGLYTGGTCIDWVMAMIMPDQPHDYAAFTQLAERAQPGCGGVYFMPHLRVASSPNYDPNGRGVFIGLSTDTTRADMARATIEGLVYELHLSLASLLEITGLHVTRHVMIGGATRNALWMTIKATVENRPLHIVEREESTAHGTALLAGLGAGVYRDLADVRSRVQKCEHVVVPDEALAALYKPRFEQVYRQIYGAVKGLHHTSPK